MVGSVSTAVLFIATCAFIAVGFTVAVGSATGSASAGNKAAASLTLWLLAIAVAGNSGVLARFDSMPPPLMLGMLLTLIVTFTIALSRLGLALATQLPLVALIGYQAFRIPVEIVLHQHHLDGVVHARMTFAGANFDIVSGLTALPIAWLAAKGRLSRGLLLGWNALGLVLLLTIVVIAVLSAPFPFQVFTEEPANRFVGTLPYAALPYLLVPAALLGHILVFRRLRAESCAGRI